MQFIEYVGFEFPVGSPNFTRYYPSRDTYQDRRWDVLPGGSEGKGLSWVSRGKQPRALTLTSLSLSLQSVSNI